MPLVADRFLQHRDGRAFDMATGDRVVLRIEAAQGTSEQARWSVRCDTLQKLHHRGIAPLVDFGPLGVSQRFEAWRCESVWSGSAAEALCTNDRVSSFLRAVGLSVGVTTVQACVYDSVRGAVVLPDSSTGYPTERDERQAVMLPLDARAIAVIPRPSTSDLGEVFRNGSDPRPHVVTLWGPSGCGKSAALLDLARMARRHGLIPIAAQFVTSVHENIWRGRSLFIINENPRAAPLEALLRGSLCAPPPHVMVLTSREELRGCDSIPMERIDIGRLVAAIEPSVSEKRMHEQVRRLAIDARGLVGRFVAAIWSEGKLERARPRPSAAGRVAEPIAAFGLPDTLEPPAAESDSTANWPTPGELTTLRRRVDNAANDLEGGRHARGMRQLRHAMAGLARRGDWITARRAAISLASALLTRGRPEDALKVLDAARRFAESCNGDRGLMDVALVGGEARVDLARLDEAESVLGAALAVARNLGDATAVAAARIALARCVFWRGRYAEAAAVLAEVREAADWPAALRVRWTLVGARIAVGRADFSTAMSLVGQAADLAGINAPLCAAVRSCAAFVHLAVGDLDGVDRETAAAISAARAAHHPLSAIRARILLAEAERRRGRSGTSRSHLKLLATRALPPLLQLRVDLIASLATATEPLAQVVQRRIASCGVGALELFTPIVGPDAKQTSCDPSLGHIIAIVNLCQTADDELVVLSSVCTRVRDQLHALGTAFFAARGQGPELLVADGAPIDQRIATRALAAGNAVAPHQIENRLEAAAAVRYAGSNIGVLCARWAPGSMYDRSQASTVLMVAAAAAAPIVSAVVTRRRSDVPPAGSELRGMTPAVGDLRHAIERAAAAPFSVLIVGESGSGKELVARAIHRSGLRRERPFCTLNCAAVPDDLVEAELFGHARGAFTGAISERPGVFEEAHGGTLFLDEVGELSSRAQAKVLRVIQEGELRRVGENAARRVDVRIVSATNRDLRDEVAAGRFRLDLLYRLDVIRIAVPPLRDRREDIALLAEHFWRDATTRIGSRATLSAAAIAALARYDWPGNVRELQNVLAALAVRSAKRGIVPPAALPPQFATTPSTDAWRLDQARRTFEEQFVRAALVRSGGRRGRAAAELGLSRQGLTKLMARLGITTCE
jgi:DNA-binding NtrC family response regulator